jgi:hypothetical protein
MFHCHNVVNICAASSVPFFWPQFRFLMHCLNPSFISRFFFAAWALIDETVSHLWFIQSPRCVCACVVIGESGLILVSAVSFPPFGTCILHSSFTCADKGGLCLLSTLDWSTGFQIVCSSNLPFVSRRPCSPSDRLLKFLSPCLPTTPTVWSVCASAIAISAFLISTAVSWLIVCYQTGWNTCVLWCWNKEQFIFPLCNILLFCLVVWRITN